MFGGDHGDLGGTASFLEAAQRCAGDGATLAEVRTEDDYSAIKYARGECMGGCFAFSLRPVLGTTISGDAAAMAETSDATWIGLVNPVASRCSSVAACAAAGVRHVSSGAAAFDAAAAEDWLDGGVNMPDIQVRSWTTRGLDECVGVILFLSAKSTAPP